MMALLMARSARVICVIAVIISILGCGKNGDSGSARSSAPKTEVDVDLSSMSSTLIFAQITNMMEKPDDYLGKTVRAKGAYSVWCMSGTDECHHFVSVSDGGACCQTGLEFQIKDGGKKYPSELTPIEIEGVYSSYEKFERTLYYLAADDITVLKK